MKNANRNLIYASLFDSHGAHIGYADLLADRAAIEEALEAGGHFELWSGSIRPCDDNFESFAAAIEYLDEHFRHFRYLD